MLSVLLKKKKGSFFQSITSLQKNSAKVSSKRDQLEEKSTGARNDYLLSIAAANAHQTRYFLTELQTCMQSMEAAVYEKVSEYLTLMGRTELLTCSATQHSFGKIRDQAQQLTREYNLQCLYLYYPVLKQHIQYEYEPCDNDPVDVVTIEHESVAQTLAQEARRWATRVVRETAIVRDATRKIHLYQAMRDAGQKVDPNDPNGPELEVRIDELRATIRRSETSKVKYEARLECLRHSGAPVDEWLKEVDLLAVQDTLPRSSSLLSVRTDASGAAVSDQPSSDSFYDSDNTEGEAGTSAPATSGHVRTTSGSQHEDDHDEDVDAVLEEERLRIESLTVGWDDPTQVSWGEPEAEQTHEQPEQPAAPLYKCTALYSYTAQNPDELSIIENEQLEVVGEGDGDGWLRARNYRGEEGYVPHNYLDVDREEQVQGDGDGWLRARNYRGEEGYVPHNYLDVDREEQLLISRYRETALNYRGEEGYVPHNYLDVDREEQLLISRYRETALNYRGEEGYVPHNYLDVDREEQAASAPGLVTQISFSSVDYTVEGEDADVVQSPDQISVISAPVAKPEKKEEITAAQPEEPTLGYCFALYDYDAEGPDELNLEEGQIIRIVSRDAHGVDDGWWKGEANGLVGNFPSLIVEECDENGEPLSTGEGDWTPPGSAPPVFASPPASPPGQGLDDEMIMGENNNCKSAAPPAAPPPPPPPEADLGDMPDMADLGDSMDSQPDFSFNIEISRSQLDQYETQFGQDDPPEPKMTPPVMIVVDEAVGENLEDQEEEEEMVPQIVEPEEPKAKPKPPKVELPESSGLGVGITATEEQDEEESSLSEQTAVCLRDGEKQAPQRASSSTSEGSATSGPPTAPHSPPQVRAGRASIPDELDSAQLARLTDLKESNA
ncbi:variant SH3 domain-containing protein [Phthorimaea operculella]|nr:variant SH3 domain-containing protein [Phthorimaea operculella]